MANAAKAKGTRWETAVVRFLAGFPALGHARRLPAQGTLDEGDIHLEPFALQCKDTARHDFASFVRDAEAQAHRAELPYGAAVVKKRGANVGDAYVVMSLRTFARMVADAQEEE